MNQILTFLFLCLVLTSCIVNDCTRGVYGDEENQGINICSVHNVRMYKRFVGTTYGLSYLSGNTAKYPNARKKVSGGCVKRAWPIQRVGIIYVCDKCNRLKQDEKKNK